jgi:hypothetical protein
MTSVIEEHPYNHYIVSAYHRAYEYYEESTLIKGYDRNNSDWSIRPNAFLYRINDDPDNPINNYELEKSRGTTVRTAQQLQRPST